MDNNKIHYLLLQTHSQIYLDTLLLGGLKYLKEGGFLLWLVTYVPTFLLGLFARDWYWFESFTHIIFSHIFAETMPACAYILSK